MKTMSLEPLLQLLYHHQITLHSDSDASLMKTKSLSLTTLTTTPPPQNHPNPQLLQRNVLYSLHTIGYLKFSQDAFASAPKSLKLGRYTSELLSMIVLAQSEFIWQPQTYFAPPKH